MNYQIKFYKHLLSSDGHPFKVLQRMIPVDQSNSSDDAIRVAVPRTNVFSPEGLRTLMDRIKGGGEP